MPLVCALQNGELAAADEQMAGEVVSEAERARWRGILGNLRLSGVQQRSGHIAPKTSRRDNTGSAAIAPEQGSPSCRART